MLRGFFCWSNDLQFAICKLFEAAVVGFGQGFFALEVLVVIVHEAGAVILLAVGVTTSVMRDTAEVIEG